MDLSKRQPGGEGDAPARTPPGATSLDFTKRKERYAATYPENEELLRWLRLETPEQVIEPELPIIDTHHHFWDHRITPHKFFKQQVYLLPEMLEDLYDGHNVVKTVYTQAHAFHHRGGPPEFRPVGEVEFCQGVAAMCDSGIYGPARVCAGIQGTVDLRHPNAAAVLRVMMRARNFRGVRAYGPYDAAFKRGLAVLGELGLVWDRWETDPAKLPELAALAREYPRVTIVMDHLGGIVGPRLSAEQAARWRADIRDLAAGCPNVICKVGGGPTNGHGFHKKARPPTSEELAEALLPWYGHAIDCFGPERCMFESNFPVEKNAVTYRTLLNAVKRVAARKGLSDAGKRALFHDTAERVYGLRRPLHPPTAAAL